MTEHKQSVTVKYAGNTVGVGLGNAFAYFGLEYLRTKGIYEPADPVVAMAMGGAIASTLLLELRKMSRGVKYVFDRIFPEKKPPQE